MPRKKSKRVKANDTVGASQITRRGFGKTFAAYAVGGAAVLGGAALFARDFKAKVKEQDLSVIGSGKPTIVQIHDPQCSMCTALQKQTRRALRAFDDEDVYYRVANIQTDVGAVFQQTVGQPHVTLMLYNRNGRHVHTINGVVPAAELTEAFSKYLRLRPN